MTQVVFAPRLENPLNDVESVIANGYVQARPSVPYVAGGQWVMDDWSETIPLTGSALTLFLDPLPTNPYEVRWVYRDNEGEEKTRSEYRIVIDSGTPVKWETLDLRYAPGTTPAPTGDFTAAIANLQAQINALSVGGASTVANVSGISTFAATYLDDTSAAATLATLGAAPLASPALTGNPTAPTPTTGDNDTSIATTAFVQNSLAGSGLSFASAALTGNPTAPTPTAGDNDTSIATTAFVNTAIAATLGTVPLPFYATGSSYDGRPVTTRPVWWMSWDVAPPATTGTTSSGTGPVPNLDVVFLALGVVPG